MSTRFKPQPILVGGCLFIIFYLQKGCGEIESGIYPSLLSSSHTPPPPPPAAATNFLTATAQQQHGIFSPHCKKWLLIFPSPARMSLIKLSLVGNNSINHDLAGDGKISNLFYSAFQVVCSLAT
jgi:hypothetical protein